MTSVEFLRHAEAAAWSKFSASRTNEDLQAWRDALQALNDELQHRARILQTSAHPR